MQLTQKLYFLTSFCQNLIFRQDENQSGNPNLASADKAYIKFNKILMNLRITLLILIQLLLTVFQMVARADESGSTRNQTSKNLVHPYLLFSETEKQQILAGIKQDSELGDIYEKIRWKGEKYLHAPEQAPPPPKNIHTRYYGSDEYRRYQEWNMDGALTLAFLYQMTGREAYAQKAFEYAVNMCNLDSWINRAHYFDIIYSRVWPYNVKDDQVVFSYDITSSSYTQRMALVYDWLYPALDKPRRDKIRNALLEKSIIQVRGNYEYHWWSTAYKCNWSSVCHAGLGLAALALMNEDPDLTDVVSKSYEGIYNVLNNFDDDGGWQEGRGYWAFALGNSALFMEALNRVSGGEKNLFRHPKILANPCDFGLFGLTAAFGDGGGGPVGSSYLINKLYHETGSENAAFYRNEFVKTAEEIYDLIWTKPTIKPNAPREVSKHFKGIDWAVMRKDFNPDNITIACKAGMNDDPHHGHLDCGSFYLTWKGKTIIGELTNSGGYDEHYFGALRWDYPQAGSKGHNVVMVNGEEQISAKYKDQPWKEGIGGKIVNFQARHDFDWVETDPTNAYPGNELQKWNRWIILDKTLNFVIVLDKVKSKEGASVESRFHPVVNFTAGKDKAILEDEASKMLMIPFSNLPFDLKADRLPKVTIRKEHDIDWHNYLGLHATSGPDDAILGCAFIPDSSREVKIEFKQEEGMQRIYCRLGSKSVVYELLDGQVRRK
jgi:hypothetical protein